MLGLQWPPVNLELTDEEERAPVALLRQTLDYTRFPYALRLDPLKAILAKLDPSAPLREPLPPLLPGMAPSRQWRRPRR